MKRTLELGLATLSLISAGLLTGPSPIPDKSPLREQTGAVPNCNAESTVLLDCPLDPVTAGKCGRQYRTIISGNIYYFPSLGTICTDLPGCNPLYFYQSTPVPYCNPLP